MYINQVYYKADWRGLIKKNLVSYRVKKYFHDLYIKNNINIEFNLDSEIYDYHDAGNYWLDFLIQHIDMKNLDFILFPQWGCTWQMEYAVPELDWLHSRGLDIPFYDIRDCGKLSVFNALKIMQQMQFENGFKKNICLSIENKFVDVNSNYKKIVPQIDYMGCIEFQSSVTQDVRLNLSLCDVINCSNHDLTRMILQTVEKTIEQFKMCAEEYIVYIKNIDGMINMINSIQIEYPQTSGFIYYCINMVFRKRATINFNYVIIIDVDEDANDIGILVVHLEKGKMI